MTDVQAVAQVTATPAPSGTKRRRYPGVRSFDEPDATRFFGRNRATEELLLRVLSVRLLLQFAPSGVGKTSLLSAGLFPRLRQHGYFPFIVRLNDPAESLVEAVRRSLAKTADERRLNDPVIPKEATDLGRLLAGTQLWSDDLLLLTPVLVFDQFEEVFTLRDDAFRKEFASAIGEITSGAARQQRVRADSTDESQHAQLPDVKVIISLREEYLGKLEEFSVSIPELFHERLRLQPLTGDEAREAIVKPAQLEGNEWESPIFEFDRACLDTLIEFIDGTSETLKVIDPLTLQLVCQRAEELAMQGGASAAGTKVLRIDDFGGAAGLAGLVRSYFRTELGKLNGRTTRRRARQMFEVGLLDPDGKRLMLEEGEIERKFRLSVPTLRQLADTSRLLRREPRNESIFYEISHDRLAEVITKTRRRQLPRWVPVALVVLAVSIAILLVTLSLIARQRTRAFELTLALLDEPLVGRLREAGLSDALAGVLSRTTVDKANTLALVLSLRHQGDLARQRGTLGAAEEKFRESLAVIDQAARTSREGELALMVERARLFDRLGSARLDAGDVTNASQFYDQSVQQWRTVLQRAGNPENKLDAAETLLARALVTHDRFGDAKRAEADLSEARGLIIPVLMTKYEETYGAQSGEMFELGRAMQVYADWGATQANIWGAGKEEGAGAYALAEEALRLRPLSFDAGKGVGTAGAGYAFALLGDPSFAEEMARVNRTRTGQDTNPFQRALDILTDALGHFDGLAQVDPANRVMQRERAALILVKADTVAICAQIDACRRNLEPSSIEDAEIAALDSIGNFRRLAAGDSGNRSFQQDVSWGLRVLAALASARRSRPDALRLFDEAIAAAREAMFDRTHDAGTHLTIAELFQDKARALRQLGTPAETLAALEAALAEVIPLPDGARNVASMRLSLAEDRLEALKALRGHGQQGEPGDDQVARLRERVVSEFQSKPDRARKAMEQGRAAYNEARLLQGRNAVDRFRQAADFFNRAIDDDPLNANYWQWLRETYRSVSTIESELQDAAADNRTRAANAPAQPSDVSREPALRLAVRVAWMARVIGTDDAASGWKGLYYAKRSLEQYLRDNRRWEEALQLHVGGVSDAEEFARRSPHSREALEILADANAGLALLRVDTKTAGWEEALRKALRYGQQLADLEPTNPTRLNWVGEFRVYLGDQLREGGRTGAPSEEYALALAACGKARQVAGARGAEADRARSCLDDLAKPERAPARDAGRQRP